ncbi:hypothetical protein M758_11G145400 [Ceratodon purpureus]|nr:hypothetical protein M758_11G145400 [Ceratodon purpureus]
MESPRGLLLALVLILSCGSFSARAEVDNVVTQWHFVAERVVRTLGVPSQIASRTFTLVYLSQYKALQLAHKTSGVHPEAAAAYAAHYVLSEIYPTQQSTIFDGVIDKQITPLKLSPAVDEATRKAGLQFAKTLLKKRAYDGSQEWVKFTPSPPGGPTGKYQFVANQTFVLYPQLATTRPFLLKSVKKYDSHGGPYAIPSAKYNAEYDELATIGNANSSKQTASFKETAKFWEGGANTSTINGQLLNATLNIIKHDTTVEETAKLFAKISIAQYDSAIAGWQQKFKYLNWRPVTALRQGDPSHKPIVFTPFLRTPPHPEYPSTHSTASGSWAKVVARHLGISLSEKVPYGSYTVATEGYPLPSRTYDTLEAAEVEVGVSRIYGGIHFRKSIEDGLLVGEDVGDYVWEHFEEQFGDL